MYILEVIRSNSKTECYHFSNTMEAYRCYNAAKLSVKRYGGYAKLVWDDGNIRALVASSDDNEA